MKPRRRSLLVSVSLTAGVVALLATACSGDDGDSGPTSTTPGSTGTTSVATSSTSGGPSTTVDPDAPLPTQTVVIATNDDVNETRPGPSTTAAATFEERIVQDHIGAALDALPEGWTGTVVDAANVVPGTAEAALYLGCGGETAYDFANLDLDSQGVARLTAQEDRTTGGVPAQATLEARVFTRTIVADTVWTLLTEALTSADGRACLEEQLPAAIGGTPPEGATYSATVEDTPIEGADAGVHAVVTVGSAAAPLIVDVDLVTKRLEDGTMLLASFVSSNGPVDPVAASAVLAAASA